MTTFAELGLIDPLQRALREENYTHPTPIQAQSIPQLLEGRDLLGCARTGTGKTAAFALPILQRLSTGPRATSRSPRALVLVPTRELAAQVAESFVTYGRRLSLSVAVVYGGVGQTPQVRALQRGVDILVATPGRLLDLMGQGYVRLERVEVLVLDEADHMLDMGFIPDVRRIMATIPKRRQTLLFSATMPPPIARLADGILSNPIKVVVTPAASTVDELDQCVHFVSNSGKGALLTRVLSDPAVERALVFTRTKRGADRVAKRLAQDGIPAEAIHGNKSQNNRERTLDGFRRGHTRVLVATDIAARGIDVDGITHVINYEMPNIPESYVHRIGRTARAGASGFAISLCDSEERPYLRDIEQLIRRQVRVEGSATGDRVAHGREDRGADRPRRANVEGARKPHGPGARAQGRSTRGYSSGSAGGKAHVRGAYSTASAPRHPARAHDSAAATTPARGAHGAAAAPRHPARAHDAATARTPARGDHGASAASRHVARGHDAAARGNGAHVPARSADAPRETRGHAHHGHNAPARSHGARGAHATQGSAHATDSPGVKRRHGPHSQDNAARPRRSNADSQHSRTAYKPSSHGHGGSRPAAKTRTGR